MKFNPNVKLPTHSIKDKASSVYIEDIGHKNPYDFTQAHRHDYFEIFFFENGGGSHLIDFNEISIENNSCYIVYPLQVHLLKRTSQTTGTVLQFREEVINSSPAITLLRDIFWESNPAVVFENNLLKKNAISSTLHSIKNIIDKQTQFSNDILLHFLQALLYQLIDLRETSVKNPPNNKNVIFSHFQQLIEEQFKSNRSVKQYTQTLHTTEKKLALLTKKFSGYSPLQLIHNRILLEAKRMLLFEDVSHKEIAYQLGFDSPASFTLFTKNKTGFTPTELQKQALKIHK